MRATFRDTQQPVSNELNLKNPPLPQGRGGTLFSFTPLVGEEGGEGQENGKKKSQPKAAGKTLRLWPCFHSGFD